LSRARLLRKTGSLVFVASIALSGTGLKAEPPARRERKSNSSETRTTYQDSARARLIESANGWIYVNGEWVHPDGYKFVNNKVQRTTAKAGKTFPNPPGKLALENPAKLTPRTKSDAARSVPEKAQTEAEKAVETRRKNLTPRPAPQTGTHL
jgi:hypothetical protein